MNLNHTSQKRFCAQWSLLISAICVLFLSHRANGFAVKHLDPAHSKNMELIRYVLNNDQDWWLVLNQKIKISKEQLPFYQFADEINPDTKTKLILINNEAEIAPLPVIQNAINKFTWLGSYVEFSVFVLHTAFACTVFEVLKVQVLLTRAMYMKIRQKASEIEEHQKVINPMVEAWKSLMMIIDKVGALSGNLELLTDLSYEYTGFILDSADSELYVLELIENEIETLTEERCVLDSTQEMFKKYGIIVNPDYLLGAGASLKEITRIYNATFYGMVERIKALNVETMARENWNQILDFQIPSLKNINLYLKIDELLKKDPRGKEILMERLAKKSRIIDNLSGDTLVTSEGDTIYSLD